MALIQNQQEGRVLIDPGDRTPGELLSQIPCLACLSEKDLQAVLLYILSTQTDYSLPDDLKTLIQDSSCVACFSKKEMLQTIISALANEFVTGETIPEIRDSMKCLQCATPQQIQAAITYLIIQVFTMSPRVLDSGIATLSSGSASVTSAFSHATNPVVLGYYSPNGATIRYDNITEGVGFMLFSSNPVDANKVSWAIVRQ